MLRMFWCWVFGLCCCYWIVVIVVFVVVVVELGDELFEFLEILQTIQKQNEQNSRHNDGNQNDKRKDEKTQTQIISMLTGRLAFSTHKQQIYCILCTVKINSATLASQSGTGSGFLISIRCLSVAFRAQSYSQVRARVRRSLLSQRQKLLEIWSRWCWWSWCRCPTAGDISTTRREGGRLEKWESEFCSCCCW